MNAAVTLTADVRGLGNGFFAEWSCENQHVRIVVRMEDRDGRGCIVVKDGGTSAPPRGASVAFCVDYRGPRSCQASLLPTYCMHVLANAGILLEFGET